MMWLLNYLAETAIYLKERGRDRHMKKILSVMLASVALFAGLVFSKSIAARASEGGAAQAADEPMRQEMQEFSVMTRSRAFPKNDYRAINYERQVGVWISYIDLSDMMRNTSQEQFRENLREAYKNIVNIGGNTVYVHVRAFADAYYPSELYPYTTAFGDTEAYDALEIMVSEAHKLGLSFHAWINPMRCGREASFDEMPDSFELKSFYTEHFGEYLNTAEGSPYVWLDPSSARVREYIAASASEIVSKYDVDGIHIDDYFYPTVTEDFDRIGFEKSGEESLSQWRMKNITRLVVQMNMQIKNTNPTVVFEISPQGNVSNNYTQLFADVENWCASTLICDNIIPQVYYGYGSSSPYLDTINKWSEMVGESQVKLVIGLAVYKIAEESEFQSTDGIIGKQLSDALLLHNVSGVAFYNYSTLFSNDEVLADKITSERDAIAEALASYGQVDAST